MVEQAFARDAVFNEIEKIRTGKTIGYTSGVFDILHAGHVDYLEQAKSHCDILVVGVNSDSSVKQYKDPGRPIIDERERAKVVSALSVVDYVFIFNERNNQTNISILKPDRYIKAGDYDKASLTSAPLIEAYGGSVVLIPVQYQTSTSDIIDRVISRYGAQECKVSVSGEKKPAVFLDRDGTINTFSEYLHEPDKFSFLPGALEGLKRLKEAGYWLIIVTNQPGIGMGYFAVEDFFSVNKAMLAGCAGAGVLIDKIYFSPDTRASGSPYRKPATGMIDRACRELPIDMVKSVVIGDSTGDVQLAKNVGLRSILVTTGNAGKDALHNVQPDATVSNLIEAAEVILSDRWEHPLVRG